MIEIHPVAAIGEALPGSDLVALLGEALVVAAVTSLIDKRGEHDRDGRPLEVTQIALADITANAADLAIGAALEAASAPVVAVSPIIGGQAVKGPTAKLMAELGIAITPRAIADHYAGIIDGLLIDRRDEAIDIGIATDFADTLMLTLADRARVASAAALSLADRLGS